MKNKVLNTINEYNILNKGDTVAVCLSGGADSMALFHFLCLEKEFFDIKIIAIHINHGLRKQSEEEENFVKNHVEKMGVKLYILNANMNDIKKPKGLSTESWAREIRYDYFKKIQEKTNAKLVTAHTASDNLETILFNLTRGTNIKGLKGISLKRENIYRPLIDVTREEIEKYCKENDIPFVDDETNFKDIYSRNKIRLKVVPVLKEINPNIEKNIFTFSKDMEDTNTFLTKLSDNLCSKAKCENGFKIKEILKEDKVIIKQFLRNILEEKNCLSLDNINSIFLALGSEKYSKQLSKNLFCHIKNGVLYFEKPEENKTENQEIDIIFDTEIDFFEKKVVFSLENIENFKKNNKNSFIYYIDYDKILNAPKIRNRRINDKITLSKRGITKSLKKLFIEDKIEKSKREKMLILSDGENVVFLEKYGVNKPYEISENTTKVLTIQFIKLI